MEEDERRRFDRLVRVLKEELIAQFGVERAHDTDEEVQLFAALLADGIWDSFTVVPRWGEQSAEGLGG